MIDQMPSTPRRLTWAAIPPGVTVISVIAILYFAREVLLPVAMALLLSFALAPIVSFLRRRGIPKVVAVVASVVSAFAVIAIIGVIAAIQISSLAASIPTYQMNVVEKVRALKELGSEGGIIERISGAVERIGAEIEEGTAEDDRVEQKPLPVEIVSPSGPWQTLTNIVVLLVSPFAAFGLTVVVVVFVLLDRENLRDRFIRLVGYSDLHRTTEALEDAGSRVGRYLLMQLVVNVLYAVPVTVGLTLIGIPNAILWGLLALVLRFVPYIGPAIAMLLPLMLSLAVAPGWSLLLWTAALFLILELVSNNIVEPWLYGSQTGLSSVAIVLSAVFWTWLWGPLGLLLSTPLTVCLVVLGKYVPQFEFLEVMLGNEPVLPPEKRLYQRLLAGDADEATDSAETYLREDYLVDFYGKVGIPALLLAEEDRQRGILVDERRAIVAASALELVENLKDIADEEEEEPEGEADAAAGAEPGDATAAAPRDGDEIELPDGTGKRIVCVGGRDELDEAVAAMLAQVFEVQGAEASVLPHGAAAARTVRQLALEDVDAVVLTFVNANALVQARQAARRLKRAKRGLAVGVYLPARTLRNEAEGVALAREMGADFVAATLPATVEAALTRVARRPVAQPAPRPEPPRSRARAAKPARSVKAAAEG